MAQHPGHASLKYNELSAAQDGPGEPWAGTAPGG